MILIHHKEDKNLDFLLEHIKTSKKKLNTNNPLILDKMIYITDDYNTQYIITKTERNKCTSKYCIDHLEQTCENNENKYNRFNILMETIMKWSREEHEIIPLINYYDIEDLMNNEDDKKIHSLLTLKEENFIEHLKKNIGEVLCRIYSENIETLSDDKDETIEIYIEIFTGKSKPIFSCTYEDVEKYYKEYF